MPELSVVIGSHNARSSVRECLSALESQRAGHDVEIIVIDNSTDGTADIIRREFPSLNLVKAPPSALIPELWGIGVRQSAGAIIATTTSHFVPRPDWIEQILLAHELPHAGIGGAIENDDSAGLVDWAVYFCRYSSYMLPFVEKSAPEIAADNASYKRSALERRQWAMQDGFWEVMIHAEFKKQGLSLSMNPAIVMSHRRSFGFPDFVRQRFRHGQQFGAARAASMSGRRRLVYIIMSPLIPLIFLSRIARQVLTKRRRVGKFLLALPVLALFLLSWSAGELSGYLKEPWAN
jgi:glycosyltransferase involved in cell wall biosynthesis